MESVAYVGMDVDKEKIAMAVVSGYEAQPRLERVVPNRLAKIQAFFDELSENYDDISACYEAGACGFELYRRVTELDVACAVIAPSSIARKPGDRIKTDRRDARKLAIGLRNGDLSPVYVPTRRDEAVRHHLRLFEDVKSDLKKAKQRLAHFLMRREIRYEDGTSWSQKYWWWLRSLKFDSEMDGETLAEYMGQVSHLEEKRIRIAERIEDIATEERYVDRVKILKSFKGIGTLTALSFVVEIGDYRRFRRAEEFMSFLALVPSEHSSGSKRRVGSITKAGNTHLRSLLVQCGWHARSLPAHSKRLLRDREGVAADIVNYADRAGRRPHKKYMRMVHAGRPSQVAVIAVARELAGFIWGAMVGQTT